ncbi:MAG: hypothetical protein K0Q90_3702 [Paenibacillaceae bacterium]|jgi:uncharacterized membrane protein|nr:hypothetical protein [Paenibacillaceae bacterium]
MEEFSGNTASLLLDELDKEAQSSPLSHEQIARISKIVEEYNTKIKCRLTEEQEKRTSRSDRLADKVASFGGSWAFILIFLAFLAIWMILNSIMLFLQFDSPPFILLNLILSCISALQAPFILMSQNRQAARDKQEALLNFAITYKAEKENDEIKNMLRSIEQTLAQPPCSCQQPHTRQGGNKHEHN